MSNQCQTQQLSHFIQRIYQAAQQPQLLSGIVRDLGQLLEAQYCAVQVENFNDHSLAFADLIGYEDQAIESYSDYFIHRDPWMQIMKKRQPNKQMFVASHQYLSDKEYRQSEFYNDWGKTNRVRHAIGAALELDNGSHLKLSFQRHADRGEFEAEKIIFLNHLHPHFKALVQLANVFKQNQAQLSTWQQQLEQLHRPVWLLDQQAKVLHQNSKAEDFIQAHNCLEIKQQTLFSKSQPKQLQQALHTLQQQLLEPFQTPGQGLKTLKFGDHSHWFHFCLLPYQQGIQHRPSFLLLGPKQTPNSMVLRHNFSLTPREAEFCLCLMQGLEMAKIAARLGLSINTCRNMLASCFKKLNCRNQAALILKLFNCYS